jgi:hypothetical protein
MHLLLALCESLPVLLFDSILEAISINSTTFVSDGKFALYKLVLTF